MEKSPFRTGFRAAAAAAVLAALALSSASRVSHAQSAGFALDRFEPSERGSDWFAVESLDLRGNKRWAAGLVLDYGLKPLVIYSPDGKSEQAQIVEHQLFAHVGATLTLIDRVRLGLDLPIALYQAGDGGVAQGVTYKSKNATTIGDLRIGADVRLVGVYHDPATLSAGLWLFAPTGSRDSYTGDGAVRVAPRINFAGDSGPVTYGAGLTMVLRTQKDDFAGANLGSQLGFSAAVGLRFAEKRVTVGPELYGDTVFSNADSFFKERTTPLELVLGVHYQANDAWRVGAGFGPGLTRGFGTPTLRALASVEWAPVFVEHKPPPPPVAAPLPSDRDTDGIVDVDDACPDVPGVKTDDPKTNGCPPDKDKDGVIDPDDACPDVAGVKTDDPKTNGCPPDRDKDSVLDADDACPDEPGVKTDDPKTNGCPPPKDTDGDTILDPEDACPKDAGPKSDDPKKNGCPLARVEENQILITEQVQFAYNSAVILKASDTLLNAVLKILTDHSEITKVSIQGHTDNKGGDAYNKRLSQARAQSVMRWLVQHGAGKNRFDAKGFGKDKPIDTNDTEEGRANNRRVEFHIIELNADVPAPAAPPEKK